MDKDSAIPGLELQLLILSKELPAGSRLPSTRELQRQFKVSPLTVRRVLARLTSRGLVETRPGAGTYTATSPTTAPRAEEDFSWQLPALGTAPTGLGEMARLLRPAEDSTLHLASSYLEEALQPLGLLSQAAARVGRRPRSWARLPPAGLDELREFFATESGSGVDDVTISPGGQAGLTAVMTAVARPGEIVLVESPTYPGALEAARLAGLRVVGVPADSGGVLPDALADAFTRTGARLFYCQPRYANPTGSLLSPERRQPVLDAVSRSRAFLLEDDWVRGLEFGGGTPAPTLASQDSGGHVVQVRSLTKPVAPGLRVAAIVSRGAITQRVRALRGASDLFVSPLLQAVALEVLTASSWQRHLSRLCRDLTARRDALVAGLRAALGPDSIPLIPRGGLSLWVKLPDGTNDEAVATKALGLGLALQPGHPFFPAEPAGPYLRLSYAAATPERLTGVGKLLAQAIS